ncbi:MAG: hypothetical protein ACLP4V_08235 [Methylocella sp.]
MATTKSAKKQKPGKRTAQSLQVRARAKAIYFECLKQSGHKPLDKVIIECLQAEGFKEYTPASIAQWRKADKWDEEGDKHVTEGGKSLSPMILSYATHGGSGISLEKLEHACGRQLDLHVKGVDFLEKWLSAKDPSTIETSEAIKLAELVARNFESALSIRIRLGEQRALEAKDITPQEAHSKEGGGDPQQVHGVDRLLRLLGPAETQRESVRKIG